MRPIERSGVHDQNDPREPLTEFADIIKVDIRQVSTTEQAAMIKRYGPWRCRLLAEKVETRQGSWRRARRDSSIFRDISFAARS